MLKVDQCLPRGDRRADTANFWLIWFCHILLPFKSNAGKQQKPFHAEDGVFSLLQTDKNKPQHRLELISYT